MKKEKVYFLHVKELENKPLMGKQVPFVGIMVFSSMSLSSLQYKIITTDRLVE